MNYTKNIFFTNYGHYSLSDGSRGYAYKCKFIANTWYSFTADDYRTESLLVNADFIMRMNPDTYQLESVGESYRYFVVRNARMRDGMNEYLVPNDNATPDDLYVDAIIDMGSSGFRFKVNKTMYRPSYFSDLTFQVGIYIEPESSLEVYTEEPGW